MIEIVWEYVIRDEARGQFELAFGPGGAWSKLFAGCPGFRGATLLRDVENQARYLTIDLWESLDKREQAMTEHAAEWADMDSTFAEWTEFRREVGVYRVLAEGTVRPRGKARRGKTYQVRRRGR